MLKFIVAALWLCAVTAGAVIYSFSAAAPAPEKKAPEYFGGLDYVKTDVISVPLIKQGRVFGYFLTRLVYTIEPKVAHTLSVPIEDLLVDEVYSYLYGNPQIDFSHYAKLDINKFRDGIRDAINKRVGRTLVHDVLVDQIDFLSKAEIRDNTIRRREGAAAAAAAE